MNMSGTEARVYHYTYADYLTWRGETRCELHEGKIHMMASPTDAHQLIVTALIIQIGNFLAGKKCKLYPAPFDVRLFEKAEDRPENVDTVLQPDLVIVCDKSKVDRRGVHGAPDMVIEVLSKSTAVYDRHYKFELYQEAGVREYWIADPDTRTVQVYRLENGSYGEPETYLQAAAVPVGVLEGCTVDLSTVFPEEAEED